jgi:hypothetical protein
VRHGLHILGVTGDALRGQKIVIEVDHIDTATLKSKLGGYGGLASLALDAADAAPRAFVDAALPLATRELRQYGIDARLTVSDAATAARPKSEFWWGLGVGGALGAGAAAIWKFGISRLFGAKT